MTHYTSDNEEAEAYPSPPAVAAISAEPETTALDPPQHKNAVLAWSIFLILAVIWGTSFILIKRGLTVYAPDELGAVRIVIACLTLLPFAIAHIRTIPKDRWKYLFISGMSGNLIPAFLFATGQTKLDSGLTGVLNSLTSLFTLLMGALLFQQKVTGMKVLGVIIGMLGTAGLIYFSRGVGASENPYYALLIVAATALYGFNVNNIKHHLQGIRPLAMSSLALLTVGPLALGYLATTGFTHKLMNVEGSGLALGYIAVLAIFSTAIGLVLFNKLLHISTALFASATTYLMPVVALMWGVLDGEPLTWVHLAGMVTILVGVSIVHRAK
jgi:drug/metabolite transporter (DMT)-like permease